MRFNILYSRKVRTKAYEMLEIGFSADYDDAHVKPQDAFDIVRDLVNRWIAEERERILRDEVRR